MRYYLSRYEEKVCHRQEIDTPEDEARQGSLMYKI